MTINAYLNRPLSESTLASFKSVPITDLHNQVHGANTVSRMTRASGEAFKHMTRAMATFIQSAVTRLHRFRNTVMSKWVYVTRGREAWIHWHIHEMAEDMNNPNVVDDFNLITVITRIYEVIGQDPRDSNLLIDSLHWFQGKSTNPEFREQYTLPMLNSIVKAGVADSPEKMNPIVLMYLVECGDILEHTLDYYANQL